MSSDTKTNNSLSLFYLGGTGYLGGTVLDILLKDNELVSQFNKITILTRSIDKSQQLKQRYSNLNNTEYVIGDLSDSNLITNLSSCSDVVMNIADADNLTMINSIINGLENRKNNNKLNNKLEKPIYIHTSGTSILNGNIPDETKGDQEYKKIWNDIDSEEFWNIPESAPHGDSNGVLLKGMNKNIIDFITVVPCTVHGIGTGLNTTSIQTPQLIRAAISRGEAGYIGNGANSWSTCNVLDMADAFILILKSSLLGKADTGRNGLYFAESGQYKHIELATKIGEILNKLDPERVPTNKISPFGPKQINDFLFGKLVGMVFGGNSICRSDRLRKLGWKASRGDVYSSLEDECKLILQQVKQGNIKGANMSMDK